MEKTHPKEGQHFCMGLIHIMAVDLAIAAIQLHQCLVLLVNDESLGQIRFQGRHKVQQGEHIECLFPG